MTFRALVGWVFLLGATFGVAVVGSLVWGWWSLLVWVLFVAGTVTVLFVEVDDA